MPCLGNEVVICGKMQISTADKDGFDASLWNKTCLRQFNQGNAREKEDHVVRVVRYSKDTHPRLAELL